MMRCGNLRLPPPPAVTQPWHHQRSASIIKVPPDQISHIEYLVSSLSHINHVNIYSQVVALRSRKWSMCRLERCLRQTVRHTKLHHRNLTLTHPYSTTTHLTTAWAESLSHIFGLSGPNKFFEYLVRGVCPHLCLQQHLSQKS
jgi:hypothetical protein